MQEVNTQQDSACKSLQLPELSLQTALADPACFPVIDGLYMYLICTQIEMCLNTARFMSLCLAPSLSRWTCHIQDIPASSAQASAGILKRTWYCRYVINNLCSDLRSAQVNARAAF